MCAKKQFRSILFFLLKFLLAAAVLYILFKRNAHEILKCLSSFDFFYLVPAFAITFASQIFSSWRWQSLAGIAGVRLSFFEAVSLTMQGNFFSLVIPGGAIGGDVVKIGALSQRRMPGSRVEGAVTVLIDRIVGMLSMFSLTLLLLGPAVPLLMELRFGNFPKDDTANILFIAATAALTLTGTVCGCGIFFHRTLSRIPIVSFLLKKAETFMPGMVTRTFNTADCYAASWKKLLLLTILTTFMVHLMAVFAFFLILAGLNIGFSWFHVMVAVVIGNIAGLIPIFPGGIGIRDLVTITILAAGAISAGDAKAAQLLATAIMLVCNLTGGIFFILTPGSGKEYQRTK